MRYEAVLQSLPRIDQGNELLVPIPRHPPSMEIAKANIDLLPNKLNVMLLAVRLFTVSHDALEAALQSSLLIAQGLGRQTGGAYFLSPRL